MDLDEALKRAEWCFHESAYPSIGNAFQLACLSDVISKIFREHLNDDHDAEASSPSSVKDFLSKTASIFSRPFLAHLESKFEEFDKLCGEPVADGFLSVGTYHAWTNLIAANTIRYYRATTSDEQNLSEAPQKTSEIVDISQFDGHSDQPPSAIPVSQISLKGTTLKQAWAEKEEVGRLFSFERLPLQNWTPSTPGGAPVFHGTSHHLIDAESLRDLDNALSSNPTQLGRFPGETQLYPLSTDISGFYTSFSALRSFLWSVFNGEVIQDPP